MRKLLSILLAVSMAITILPISTVYAVNNTDILYDFEGFAGRSSTQDSTTLTWMGYSEAQEDPWTSANFSKADTWLEPGTRTGSKSGTTMRMVTKDNTTSYNANNRYVFMSRPKQHVVSTTYPEVWFSFDWMVEDHNAEHSMRAYLQKAGGANEQQQLFTIGTNGTLSTLAGSTSVTVAAGSWHTYEMCMSATDGVMFYLDGQLLNSTSAVYTTQANWMFMQTLQRNYRGRYKGSAMQIDDYRVTSYKTPQNKRLWGIKNGAFSESEDGITFSGIPFNRTNTSKPYFIVLNVYDEAGNYVAYNSTSGAQASGTAATPVTVTVSQWESGYTAKAYVQNSVTDRTLFSDEIYHRNIQTKPKVFLYKNFDTATGGLSGFQIAAATGGKLVEAGTESYYELSAAAEKYAADVAFSGATDQLVFEAMVKQENSGTNLEFYYVDSANAFDCFLTVNANGSVKAGKTTVGTLRSGAWNRISIATDFSTHQMTVWLNGAQVATNMDRALNNQTPIKIRIHRPESTTGGKVSIDNLRIYSGNSVVKIDEASNETISILGNDSIAKSNLVGKQAVHAYSSNIVVDGVKKTSMTPAFIEDGIIYVGQDDLSQMLDVGLIGYPGSDVVRVSSTPMLMTHKAIDKDGSVYLPAKELAEMLNRKTLQGERGLLLISDNAFTMDAKSLQEVNDYMQYGRVTPDEVLSLLSESTAHPRTILSAEQVGVIRNAYQTRDAKFMTLYRNGLKNLFFSDRAVNETTPTSSIFWYTISFISGWLSSHDRTMKAKVWDAVEILCNQPNWDVENDSLGRAHSTIVVAMAYDLMYDEWDDSQKKLMEDCIIEYGLKPIKEVLEGNNSNLTNVFALGNNINAICASAAIIGAAAVWEKAPELSAYVMAESMHGLERVQNNFYPHGGWAEGVDYAAYMMSLLPLGLSTIENSLGSDFGFLTAPGVKEQALFAMATTGNCGANNYHDGSDWSAYQANDGVSIAWAAHAYESPEYYQLRKDYKTLIGIVTHPQDILYYHPEWENNTVPVENPLDSYFADSEFFSMRSDYTKEGTYLSGHFGAESVSHSHYDNGTFVLDMLGERWAIDLGKDDYNLPGYFVTGTRDLYYRVRPEGHNTVVIGPDDTLGHNYHGFGTILDRGSSEDGAFVVADMSSVYDNAVSAKRGFMLTDERSSVIIRDEIRTTKPCDVYWFMHTAAEIEIVDSNTAVLTQNGKQITVSFVTSANNAVLSKMDAVPLSTSPNPDGQMTNEGVSKIAICLPSAEDVDLTVRITPAGSSAENTDIPDISLSQWEISGN